MNDQILSILDGEIFLLLEEEVRREVEEFNGRHFVSFLREQEYLELENLMRRHFVSFLREQEYLELENLMRRHFVSFLRGQEYLIYLAAEYSLHFGL